MFHKVLACFRALFAIWVGILTLHLIKIPANAFYNPANSLQANVYLPKATQPKILLGSKNPFLPNQNKSLFASRTTKKEILADWVLCGTVVSGGKSKVILENKITGEQKWVSLGERVGENQIVSIKRKSVVLEKKRSQTQVVLSFDSSKALPKSDVQMARSFLTPSSEVLKIKEHEFYVKKSLIRRLGQKIPSLVKSLELILFEMDTKPQGYLVSVGPQLMQMAPLGIEDGDLIRKVNGRPVTSETELLNVFQNIVYEKEIQVEIDRGDQIMNFTYHVQP